MKVFLFPGQGSQEIGMASDLFQTDAEFRDLVQHAGELTGTDLERICRRGPDRELTDTRNLQPLLVCVSLGYLRHLEKAGIAPDVVLGHSLGEISALAAAGVVTPERAVEIAARRGSMMARAAGRVVGGMTAVASGARETATALLARELPGAQVVMAIDNAPNQFVLSGELGALDQAARLMVSAGLGPCRRLAVAGPWHSPLMSSAREEFGTWLEGVGLSEPRVPLWFNVTGRPEGDPSKIRELLARNLVEPVLWRSAMEQLRGAPDLTLFEVGPGRVLSGLARANGLEGTIRAWNINNLRGVELARCVP